jgi:hypothetical protein
MNYITGYKIDCYKSSEYGNEVETHHINNDALRELLIKGEHNDFNN